MEFSKLLKPAFLASVLMTAPLASHALVLTPGDSTFDGNDVGLTNGTNCEPGCVNDLFGTDFSNGEELYKNDFVDGFTDGTDSGSFSDSYQMLWTDFKNIDDLKDPTGGTLSWISGEDNIICGECYIAVKDGNNDPRYYFFDLSFGSSLVPQGWDGKEDLVFSGFWSGDGENGAISHITIWGNPSVSVPEPGTLGLLGLGLMGMAYSRKKLASK